MIFPRLSSMVLAAALLAGCVSAGGDDTAARRLYGVGQTVGAGKRLVPLTTIAGYMRESGTGIGMAARLLTGVEAISPIFPEPVSVAATETELYVVDAVEKALYRFSWQIADSDHATPDHLQQAHAGLSHPSLERVTPLLDLKEPLDVALGPDGDIFVADGEGGAVYRYAPDGELVHVFRSEEHLKRPVAVAVDSRGLRIFIADGLYDRIVVFNPSGRPLYAIGQRGEGAGEFQNIRDMVQGGDGLLYVVDGIRRHVGVYGLDGSLLTSFGANTVTDPGGIAVDAEGRVLLADQFNHRLVILADGRLVEVYGENGLDPGEFYVPASLAIGGGMLFVADRRNSRVQVFRLVPERVAREGAPSS